MSAPDTRPRDPIPKRTDVGECHSCRSVITLVKGYVLRRHTDQRTSRELGRADRICANSGTRNWSALSEDTSLRARTYWSWEDAQ